MLKKKFARALISVSACVVFHAEVGSAQNCPTTVTGIYSYTAIGNGVPGALITAGTTTGTGTGTGSATTPVPAFSNTGVGQLLGGSIGSTAFAGAGTLYFDASGIIRAGEPDRKSTRLNSSHI